MWLFYMLHSGDCHCGRIKFEFECGADANVLRCNCSICDRVGFLHLIIPKSAFELLTPWDDLGLYTFNTGVAKHYFCKTCSVKPFYIPRSNPDGFSVNFRNVDRSTFDKVTVSRILMARIGNKTLKVLPTSLWSKQP